MALDKIKSLPSRPKGFIRRDTGINSTAFSRVPNIVLDQVDDSVSLREWSKAVTVLFDAYAGLTLHHHVRGNQQSHDLIVQILLINLR